MATMYPGQDKFGEHELDLMALHFLTKTKFLDIKFSFLKTSPFSRLYLRQIFFYPGPEFFSTFLYAVISNPAKPKLCIFNRT